MCGASRNCWCKVTNLKTFGKIALLLWMEAVIYAAFTFLPPVPGFRVPALAKIMIFHVPNAMVASIISLISAFFAARYLYSRDLIDDVKSSSAASLATLFWVLTTVTGMLFAKIQWGVPWNWDPKQSAIFVLLLIYLAYFALRAAFVDPRKRGLAAAGWTIFAAMTAPFLTFVLPNAQGVQSLHPQGVVFTMKGMGPDYRMIFWGATVGFLALSVWLFRIQVALETIKINTSLARLNKPAAVNADSQLVDGVAPGGSV
jgi:heme exporter protein C